MSEKNVNIIWIVVGVMVGVAAGYFLTAPMVQAPADQDGTYGSTAPRNNESEEIVIDNGEVDISNDMIDTVSDGVDRRQMKTVQGKVQCLKPNGPTDPLALECATGIEATTGEFYALDLANRPAEGPQDLFAEEQVEVSGYYTPVEVLSTDHWMKYDIEGIVSVTEVKEI